MIRYALHENPGHLEEILDLQKKNLKEHLTVKERSEQGFVTLKHDVHMLENMCGDYRHLLAIDNEMVVGYALIAVLEAVSIVPALRDLVEIAKNIKVGHHTLKDLQFIIMGQVCIDIRYRGKGLFEGLYHCMQNNYASRVPFLITEIAASNMRSIRAHEKVGFIEVSRHMNDLDEWIVVMWDWRK